MTQYKHKKIKSDLTLNHSNRMGSGFTLNNFCSGFTLMEVLVASSIFALILIFTTAAVSQSSGYQSKLSILNKTSEETRRLADMISTDVRGANSNLNINAKLCAGSGINNYSFKNGLAILKLEPSGSYCLDYQVQKNENNPNEYTGSALIIANKDGYKIYVARVDSTGETQSIYYKPFPTSHGTITQNDIAGVSEKFSNPNLLVSVKFGGYAPEDTASNYGQPIVRFDVTAKTSNENIANTGQSEIRSAVTSRSYN